MTLILYQHVATTITSPVPIPLPEPISIRDEGHTVEQVCEVDNTAIDYSGYQLLEYISWPPTGRVLAISLCSFEIECAQDLRHNLT